ncbi:Type 1 glutamine amidotransferase-like domain-containing protein [Patescibacteria group bacterium]
MKLLLTSSGITNNSIANALFELTNKKPEETTVVFIPNASNIESGDKDWFITDLINLKKQNFKSIEITDISAVDEKIWKPSLERADVLFFEGGNTYHLMRWLNKSGLSKLLPNLLKDKVYVGVSAGSMVTNPDLALKLSQAIYEEDMLETEELDGLNFVDFYFLPHLNSECFKKMRKDNIEKVGQEINRPIYALDDDSALKIVDGKIEVITEGEWFVINKTE